MHPGELVISTHPEQVPVLRYYLGDGLPLRNHAGACARRADLRLASMPSPGCGPSNMQADARPDCSRPCGPGSEFVVVTPVFRDYRAWNATWTQLVWEKSTA